MDGVLRRGIPVLVDVVVNRLGIRPMSVYNEKHAKKSAKSKCCKRRVRSSRAHRMTLQHPDRRLGSGCRRTRRRRFRCRSKVAGLAQTEVAGIVEVAAAAAVDKDCSSDPVGSRMGMEYRGAAGCLAAVDDQPWRDAKDGGVGRSTVT